MPHPTTGRLATVGLGLLVAAAAAGCSVTTRDASPRALTSSAGPAAATTPAGTAGAQQSPPVDSPATATAATTGGAGSVLPPGAQASLDALASFAAAVGGSGPGGGATPTAAPITAPTAASPTSGSSTAAASTGSGGSAGAGTGTTQLPADFPLPPGAQVQGVVDDGREIDATVTVDAQQAAYDFWRRALPAHGWAIASAQDTPVGAEVRFRGHGFAGDTQIALRGTSAAVQLVRG